jgi:hypothetical protein
VTLVRALSDTIGLTAGLSKALAATGCWSMTGGRVMADLGVRDCRRRRVISDFRVIGDQDELFGLVASVSTASWLEQRDTVPPSSVFWPRAPNCCLSPRRASGPRPACGCAGWEPEGPHSVENIDERRCHAIRVEFK